MFLTHEQADAFVLVSEVSTFDTAECHEDDGAGSIQTLFRTLPVKDT
ncbi:hypothetical protein [Larkinella arboricola]